MEKGWYINGQGVGPRGGAFPYKNFLSTPPHLWGESWLYMAESANGHDQKRILRSHWPPYHLALSGFPARKSSLLDLASWPENTSLPVSAVKGVVCSSVKIAWCSVFLCQFSLTSTSSQSLKNLAKIQLFSLPATAQKQLFLNGVNPDQPYILTLRW